MIAAVSEDAGLENYLIFPRSISIPEFITFVEKLSAKFGG